MPSGFLCSCLCDSCKQTTVHSTKLSFEAEQTTRARLTPYYTISSGHATLTPRGTRAHELKPCNSKRNDIKNRVTGSRFRL